MWFGNKNIATFSHLLKKVDFDAVVDHLAITHIMGSKAEPPQPGLKRKGHGLSDILSRQKNENSNPHEIIPISFILKSLSHEHFYQFNNMTGSSETERNRYLIQTRSQAKSSGTKIPEIHGVNKGINPHVKPGRQRPLPMPPTCSILPTDLTPPADKGLHTQPIPKPRFG